MNLHIPSVGPEINIVVFGFPITNTMLLTWIVMAFLIIIALLIKRGFNIVPNGLQNIFELIVEYILDLIERIFGSRKDAEKYFPFIATIFFFVLFSNWFGILPGVGPFGIYDDSYGAKELIPIFRAGSSDLNLTLMLALITVATVNIMGIAALGFFKYIGRFISFKSPTAFFVGILELISEVARIVSFSFRLFGNMFAGEIMLIIALFFLPFIVPVPLLGLKIFIGLIQAAVFAVLAAVFISIAIKEQH